MRGKLAKGLRKMVDYNPNSEASYSTRTHKGKTKDIKDIAGKVVRTFTPVTILRADDNYKSYKALKKLTHQM